MRHIRPVFRSAATGFLALALIIPRLGMAQSTPATPEVAARLRADRALLASETYVTPPVEVARLVTAPRHLNVSLSQPSPDRRHFLKEQSEGLPSVQSFGKAHYYFGGLQVDGRANRARSLTTRGAAGLQLIDAVTGATTSITVPAGATVSSPTWSPDGSQLAFIVNFEDASRIYVADVTTGRSRAVGRSALLATLVTGIDWTADGRSVIAVLIPEPRMPEPKRPAIATGPQVRLWMDSVKAPVRNFASLLEEPHDIALMEYYVTGQLALLDVKTGAARKIGAPAMISSVDGSPDGRYFRVTTLRKPFSYVVQYSSFGDVQELWDANGKVLAEVSKRALREGNDTTGGGFGGRSADGARRGLDWMPQGDGLYYLESIPAAPRGDDSTGASAPAGGRTQGAAGTAAGGAARPDRLVQWHPPFGPADTTVLYRGDGPIAQVLFSDDARTIFVAATRSGTGEIFAVHLAEPAKRLPIVRERGYTPAFAGRGGFGGGGGRGGNGDDSLSFYTNPGVMMTKRGTRGGTVALLSPSGAVYLSGTQYARNWQGTAPRPFVDKVEIATGTRTRVFESATDVFETIGAPLDDDFSRATVIRESSTMVPNSYLRDMSTGALTKLTDNRDPSPEFTSLVRQRIFVTRADGYKFLVNLTLPAGYAPGTRLPGMFWFYPYEYTNQAGYDRTLRSENVNRFQTSGPRTIEYLATQGYAVANFNPPIMGDAGRMNDNYISDLRMNLSAVIDELDRQGFIDRTRLGLGGHSYGAFSTVNAMVNTPFFKAGIAGDGMYNRTLTPTGFQSERRDLWSGQKTYLDMSPMLSADKLQGALLMYHSMEDQNVGTDPISSIRMMQALRAQGKRAALFMYPYEDHGPATSETILDQWARWTAWLNLYVKHAGVQWPTKDTVTADSTPEPSVP